MSSPTQRSLQLLRKEGWTTQVVEHWIPFARVRKDLFGCIDLLAMRESQHLLGIQATSTGNIMARVHKSLALPELATWLKTGSRFEVWGWSKRGPRKVYMVRKIVVFVKDGKLEFREKP